MDILIGENSVYAGSFTTYYTLNATEEPLINSMLKGNTQVTFFIEGVSDTDVGVFTVYVKTNVDYVMMETFESPNITININPTYNYIVSYDSKVRPIDPNMIKGYITGTVDYADCNGSTFFIRCCCTDGFHVGDYQISNNVYMIPNLDVNKLYDVLLIDSTSYLETKVRSRRTPTTY